MLLLSLLAVACLWSCDNLSLPGVSTPDRNDIRRRWQESNRMGLQALESKDPRLAQKYFEGALRQAKLLGNIAPEYAATLNNLASAYQQSGDFRKAQQSYEDALAAFKESSGFDHPAVAMVWENLGGLFVEKGDLDNAAYAYKQALMVLEAAREPDKKKIATNLHNLAKTYRQQGEYTLAEPLYKRALKTRVYALGTDDPTVISDLDNYSQILRAVGKIREAEAIEKIAARQRSKQAPGKEPD